MVSTFDLKIQYENEKGVDLLIKGNGMRILSCVIACVVNSCFEKGFHIESLKCTRQDRKEVWVIY